MKARPSGKRIRFPDAERALLVGKAKAVGRKALLELDDYLTGYADRIGNALVSATLSGPPFHCAGSRGAGGDRQ